MGASLCVQVPGFTKPETPPDGDTVSTISRDVSVASTRSQSTSVAVVESRAATISSEKPQSAAVEIVLVGETGRDPAFARRVTSWFEPERYRVALHRLARLAPSDIAPSAETRVVRVFVLMRDVNHVRLYFAYGPDAEGRRRYLLRDLELVAGTDEVGSENLAQVLYLSTVALLEGQAESRRDEVEHQLRQEVIMQPSAEPRRPSARRPQQIPDLLDGGTPARRRHITRELGLGYGMSLRGDEGVWHGPRILVGVRVNEGWGVLALGQSSLPVTRQMAPLALTYYGGLLVLAGSYEHELGQGTALEWSLGPGLEIVRYRPVKSLDRTVAVGRGDTETRPGATAGLTGLFRHSSPRIAVGAHALVPFGRTHYNLVTSGGRHRIGGAPLLIPSLDLEIRF